MGQAASKKPHWKVPETAGRACLLLGQALHQKGYPVEITTCMAPSGCYWRCTLTFNSKDCIYSSANGWALFGGGGWKGWQGYAIEDMLPLILSRLGIKQTQERSLWTGSATDIDIVRVDWYDRMMEVTAPHGICFEFPPPPSQIPLSNRSHISSCIKGIWSQFSDYGGYELLEMGDSKDTGEGSKDTTFATWVEVFGSWKKDEPHDFLLYPQREALGEAAKDGEWDVVKRILTEHPTWVGKPAPPRCKGYSGDNEAPSRYTPLHHAAAQGKKEVVEWMLSPSHWPLPMDLLKRTCEDGTPVEVARKSGHEQLALFIQQHV